MTFALWSLVIATLMVYLSKIPLNVITLRNEAYDNHQPRLQHSRQSGVGHRAWAAHQNMIEAYPLFAAGILVAESWGGNHPLIDSCALAFLVARVLFQTFYLLDWPTARSLSWSVGFGATLMLLISPGLNQWL